MIYIFDEIEKINDDDFSKISRYNLSKLPNSTKKYLKYYDKLRHEIAIYLISICLKNMNLKHLENKFEYDKFGAPRICNLFVSISHSKYAVIIAIDTYPIGVDVEEYVEDVKKISTIVLSKQEYEIINNAKELTFIINIKEAYLKNIGKGLMIEPSKLNYSNYIGKANFYYDKLNYSYYTNQKYSYATCSRNKQNVIKIDYNYIKGTLEEI